MQETAKMVIEALKPVAEKLGEGAAHLYEVYTRQMFAEGIAGLIWNALTVIVAIVALVMLQKLYRLVSDSNDDAIDKAFYGGMTAVVGLVVIGALSLSALSSFNDNLTKVINPEYHAINRLLDQVKGK